jgi:hypothetical protein
MIPLFRQGPLRQCAQVTASGACGKCIAFTVDLDDLAGIGALRIDYQWCRYRPSPECPGQSKFLSHFARSRKHRMHSLSLSH